MTEARKKMIERIKAMLNSSGRTEAEMMAFLAKARELMATYEIGEGELAAGEKAQIHKTAVSDPYEIKSNLAVNVGKFTGCVGVKSEDIITFLGKQSDILFAIWLLDTLQRFVMRALRQYQADRAKKHLGNSNHTSASFVVGCAHRINEKLKQLIPITWAKNQELILKELSLTIGRVGRGKSIDQNAAKSGMRAGASATFNRPVEAGGMRYLK